jgi:hypothetical protein
VNDPVWPKTADKSVVRTVIDIARGAGAEGVVVLGSIFCIAHYGRTDLSFLAFSPLAIWSLLAFRFLSSRRAAGDRIRAIEQRSRPIIHDG